MRILKIFAYSLAIICLTACSEAATEINERTAQEIYNGIRGTYVGNVVVDNIPQAVFVTIEDDFTVRQLPLKPILERIFTNATELTEALSSARDVVFKAPTENMTISGNSVLLTMTDTDLIFTVTVNGKSYQVTAMTASYTEVNSYSKELSLYMEIKELLCGGQSYDVTTNRITYSIDVADKLATD